MGCASLGGCPFVSFLRSCPRPIAPAPSPHQPRAKPTPSPHQPRTKPAPQPRAAGCVTDGHGGPGMAVTRTDAARRCHGWPGAGACEALDPGSIPGAASSVPHRSEAESAQTGCRRRMPKTPGVSGDPRREARPQRSTSRQPASPRPARRAPARHPRDRPGAALALTAQAREPRRRPGRHQEQLGRW